MSAQMSLSQFFSLLWVKAWFNLKSETSKTYLSYLWWIIEPALYMTVFYVVFGLILERGGPGFIWFLLTGYVPFQWFSKSLTESASSILQGKGLMQKLQITPLFFPLASILKTGFKQVPVFVVLFLTLSFGGDKVDINWGGFMVVMILQLIFIISLCILVSLIVPYIRDVVRIIPIFNQFMLFTSGVFYSVSRIPEEWQALFYLNPVAGLLSQYRRVLLEGNWPDPAVLFYICMFILPLLVIILTLYHTHSSDYARAANE